MHMTVETLLGTACCKIACESSDRMSKSNVEAGDAVSACGISVQWQLVALSALQL
jgi:hypothetical protein